MLSFDGLHLCRVIQEEWCFSFVVEVQCRDEVDKEHELKFDYVSTAQAYLSQCLQCTTTIETLSYP